MLQGKKAVFEVHTKGMRLDQGIEFESLQLDHEDLRSGKRKKNSDKDVLSSQKLFLSCRCSAADIKSICSEAGIMALRDMRKCVTQEDFDKAKKSVLIIRKGVLPALATMFN